MPVPEDGWGKKEGKDGEGGGVGSSGGEEKL